MPPSLAFIGNALPPNIHINKGGKIMSSQLREQFIHYLTLQRYSPKTHKAYIDAVYGLARYHMKSPDTLTNDEIQEYLRYLIEGKKLAWSSCNVIFSGLNSFYKNIVKWEETQFFIPRRPRSKKIPMVLSIEEVARLINVPSNLKHRVLLKTVYSAGLRVSEVVLLKPHHIESDPSRMMIRVEQGKGRKDRYTILSKKLLPMLRDYWQKCKPKEWLFPGRTQKEPMSPGTAQRIYHTAKQRAGITKGRGIHTLRHCFASHLLWGGEDMYTIKRLLGHSSIKTTVRYLHVTQDQINAVISPLDMQEGGGHEN